jgi:hypothetical protein
MANRMQDDGQQPHYVCVGCEVIKAHYELKWDHIPRKWVP